MEYPEVLILSAFSMCGSMAEVYHSDAFVRFLNPGRTGLSINPDAPLGRLGVGGGSWELQHIGVCHPANRGAYHAARSNKKGIRKLTAAGEQSN